MIIADSAINVISSKASVDYIIAIKGIDRLSPERAVYRFIRCSTIDRATPPLDYCDAEVGKGAVLSVGCCDTDIGR